MSAAQENVWFPCTCNVNIQDNLDILNFNVVITLLENFDDAATVNLSTSAFCQTPAHFTRKFNTKLVASDISNSYREEEFDRTLLMLAKDFQWN